MQQVSPGPGDTPRGASVTKVAGRKNLRCYDAKTAAAARRYAGRGGVGRRARMRLAADAPAVVPGGAHSLDTHGFPGRLCCSAPDNGAAVARRARRQRTFAARATRTCSCATRCVGGWGRGAVASPACRRRRRRTRESARTDPRRAPPPDAAVRPPGQCVAFHRRSSRTRDHNPITIDEYNNARFPAPAPTPPSAAPPATVRGARALKDLVASGPGPPTPRTRGCPLPRAGRGGAARVCGIRGGRGRERSRRGRWRGASRCTMMCVCVVCVA